MKLPTKVDLIKIQSEDGSVLAELVTIACDKQSGHDLALFLMTHHAGLTESLQDLKMRLDAELIGDPASRQYLKHGGGKKI